MNTEPIQHDPKAKQQIKNAIYEFLYAPVTKRFKERLQTIVERNAMLVGSPHMHFMHRGVLYNCDVNPLPRKLNRLHLSLHDVMNAYLRDLHDVENKEAPYVTSYLNQMLNASNYLEDYLRLFPEVIHDPVRQFIASCPCKGHALPEEAVDMLQKKNQPIIDMIKRRMVTNLLL